MQRIPILASALVAVFVQSDVAARLQDYAALKTSTQITLNRSTMIGKISSNCGRHDAEHYSVPTVDGYTLAMFRIPKLGGNPVLLQHALCQSSIDWVLLPPVNERARSLGCILAASKHGYDVWFGNNRGNGFSGVPAKFGKKRAWSFSFTEFAVYDLPAQIEFVLNTTRKQTLSYIGHSQGTMQAFAGFSRYQGLADRVNVFIALAPVAYMSHQPGITDGRFGLQFLQHRRVFEKIRASGIYALSDALTSKLLSKMGSGLARIHGKTTNFLVALVTGDTDKINYGHLQEFLKFTPSGTSVKNMIHFEQGVRWRDWFGEFDYESEYTNCVRYGSREPPSFELGNINMEVRLFVGENDNLTPPEDVKLLYDQLGQKPTAIQNGVRKEGYYKIPEFAHLDFNWAEDAHELVYYKVLEELANTPKVTPGSLRVAAGESTYTPYVVTREQIAAKQKEAGICQSVIDKGPDWRHRGGEPAKGFGATTGILHWMIKGGEEYVAD